MSKLGDEKENDRLCSKDQSPLAETPAERGLLSSGIPHGARNNSSQRGEVSLEAAERS
jgi:hypothetical protein